jgi:hypothetical protein
MTTPKIASETLAAAAQFLCGDGAAWKAQFASLIGVRPDSVDAWAKGRSRIPPGVWGAIAALFYKRQTELPIHLQRVLGFIDKPPEYRRTYVLPNGRNEVVEPLADGNFPVVQFTRARDPNWTTGWISLSDDARQIPTDARGYRIVRDELPENTTVTIVKHARED